MLHPPRTSMADSIARIGIGSTESEDVRRNLCRQAVIWRRTFPPWWQLASVSEYHSGGHFFFVIVAVNLERRSADDGRKIGVSIDILVSPSPTAFLMLSPIAMASSMRRIDDCFRM